KGVWNHLSNIFEGVGKEQLVLPDRPADVSSERIDMRRRPSHARKVLVERVRVQMSVLEEFKSRSVKLVRAVLGDDVDHAAQRPTVLSVEIGGLYFKFAHGL